MDPKSKQALDAFGQAVVHEVYDRTLTYLQRKLSRGMKGNRPDPLHLAYQALDAESAETLRKFLVEAVDQTFVQFLAFFDAHEIPILFPAEDGESLNVTAASDGLPAEPYNDEGWIVRFSKYKNGLLNA